MAGVVRAAAARVAGISRHHLMLEANSLLKITTIL
jgi:hypothetical protein